MENLAPRPGDLEPIETASRDEIADLQMNRMAWSLRHAYDNSPFYRARFDDAGVHPDDLTTLSDLAKFPFTTKADLRDNYPFGLFAVPRDKIARIHASSGTTGKPTVVGYTRADIDMWADMVARSIRASGGRAGDVIHVAYGYGLFTGGLGAHYGAERLGATVVPASGGMTERQVTLIEDFGARVIMVTPSYMLSILDEYRRQGRDPRQSPLAVGIFGAEPWTNAMRAEIEQAFDIHAVDIYGLSEVLGPGVANECVETKDGLHIWEDHFYPEIIDPDTGEVLPDGELGELVFTTLTKEGLPIIRYRTRDLTRLLPGTARSMRRMEKITGRSDDMIILRGVNVFPTQVEEQLMKVEGLAPHFQIRLTRPGRMDEMEIIVEAMEHAAGDDARAASARTLSHHIKSVIGISARIEVGLPGTAPRSEGKARRVVDDRPRD
ncbi:phenylacetate--CoA ligase [Ponticoccus sp. SC2-23]|uniref:phenylacetate--CoA ligase PaaK n=1 Tax=Alexandriicola marinus TaxID=2081710 RepID=UPI000FD9C60D|nr:phenylacetate--CoA ligase PaaK [Alexandriicola marinus]MBM1221704.1 phenylacetate--CoA ligase [Ponticoccus sp. SC6-9]MBM1226055.1 phenylacetate--CoA ligase [Ponticoccus sp. SC6-15]MBM1231352.1 phenylacetate--CoA ligase [Ponticoccus sp. SC6-38]MBM1235787.1 phenylacetate--CoA ligase [Ponticoccus sp. SC6-45]MBM1240375.1 phenylacetate--CoA ligase [Ponticoccus sp. SC6-49]MBM1244910.1 phenylacetate--CoA ligase [Ponticoccus sp. SC2-64]MBM1249261.1 phenylacetate--CoA ligase [Ponticoccus sp. SC6-4